MVLVTIGPRQEAIKLGQDTQIFFYILAKTPRWTFYGELRLFHHQSLGTLWIWMQILKENSWQYNLQWCTKIKLFLSASDHLMGHSTFPLHLFSFCFHCGWSRFWSSWVWLNENEWRKETDITTQMDPAFLRKWTDGSISFLRDTLKSKIKRLLLHYY